MRLLLERSHPKRLIAVTLVVFGGFLVFDPDWFHVLNGLDPFFYTGQSANLRRVVALGAAEHYFLARWTVYLPETLFQRVLGVQSGFITIRLLLLCVALFAISALSRRGSVLHIVVVSVTVGFSPLVLRAVFVDYSDTIVVPLGIALVVLSTRSLPKARFAIAIGLLSGCMLVAQPFAIVPVTICVISYCASIRHETHVLKSACAVGVAVMGVLGVGWLAFRMRYDIPNLYGPGWRFILDHLNYPDPYKSPRLLWLGYRLWIYLPVFIGSVAAALSKAGLVEWSRQDRMVLRICCVQYAFQIWYQFSRDGSTLEISYYFTYVIPAYSVAMATVLFRSLERCRARDVIAICTLLVVGLAAISMPSQVRYGSWIDAFWLAILLVWLIRRFGSRWPVLVPVAVIFMTLSAQLLAPSPEPRLPNETYVEPGYDRVFDQAGSPGIAQFRDARAFMDHMAKLDDKVAERLSFVLGGASAGPLGATYSAQVSSPLRWLNPPIEAPDWTFDIALTSVDRFTSSQSRYVAIISAPEEFAPIRARMETLGFDFGANLLDFTTAQSRPTRTVVFAATVK